MPETLTIEPVRVCQLSPDDIIYFEMTASWRPAEELLNRPDLDPLLVALRLVEDPEKRQDRLNKESLYKELTKRRERLYNEIHKIP